jgi:hypothetical protein
VSRVPASEKSLGPASPAAAPRRSRRQGLEPSQSDSGARRAKRMLSLRATPSASASVSGAPVTGPIAAHQDRAQRAAIHLFFCMPLEDISHGESEDWCCLGHIGGCVEAAHKAARVLFVQNRFRSRNLSANQPRFLRNGTAAMHKALYGTAAKLKELPFADDAR